MQRKQCLLLVICGCLFVRQPLGSAQSLAEQQVVPMLSQAELRMRVLSAAQFNVVFLLDETRGGILMSPEDVLLKRVSIPGIDSALFEATFVGNDHGRGLLLGALNGHIYRLRGFEGEDVRGYVRELGLRATDRTSARALGQVLLSIVSSSNRDDIHAPGLSLPDTVIDTPHGLLVRINHVITSNEWHPRLQKRTLSFAFDKSGWLETWAGAVAPDR